jgi:hypothetical protein
MGTTVTDRSLAELLELPHHVAKGPDACTKTWAIGDDLSRAIRGKSPEQIESLAAGLEVLWARRDADRAHRRAEEWSHGEEA